MEEAHKRVWDVVLGVLWPILVITGILIVVQQFDVSATRRIRLQDQLLRQKDTIEFHRKLWLAKLDTYRGLVVLAGKITAAVAYDSPERSQLDPLAGELTVAYWRQTVFVEDPQVGDALRDFYHAVMDYQAGLAGALDDDRKVRSTAQRLADACKAALSRDTAQDAAL